MVDITERNSENWIIKIPNNQNINILKIKGIFSILQLV